MQWSYKRFAVPIGQAGQAHFDPDTALEAFGSEGWELVSVTPRSAMNLEIWHFKRPRATTERQATVAALIERAIGGDEEAVKLCLLAFETRMESVG